MKIKCLWKKTSTKMYKNYKNRFVNAIYDEQTKFSILHVQYYCGPN